MINLSIGCGATIEATIQAAKDTATVMKDEVQFMFNGRYIIVDADSKVAELCKDFSASKVGDAIGPNTKAEQQNVANWLVACGH